MSTSKQEILQSFRENFVVKSTNSKTSVWWAVPNTGEPEIASPTEVEHFLSQALDTIAQEAVKGEREKLRNKVEALEFNDETCKRVSKREVLALLTNNMEELNKIQKENREDKIRGGAKDFAERFEGVMRDLATDEESRCKHGVHGMDCNTCYPES